MGRLLHGTAQPVKSLCNQPSIRALSETVEDSDSGWGLDEDEDSECDDNSRAPLIDPYETGSDNELIFISMEGRLILQTPSVAF